MKIFKSKSFGLSIPHLFSIHFFCASLQKNTRTDNGLINQIFIDLFLNNININKIIYRFVQR